jgi:galactonate dehydratase
VPIAPHCIASSLGIAASFHVTASIPMFLIHESYANDMGGVLKQSWEVDQEGYASLPQGPGLGVEVDEAALAKAEPTKYKWPGQKLPDGSVADY